MSERHTRWPSTASSLYSVPADDESGESDASSSSASSYAGSARSAGEPEFSPAQFLSASLSDAFDATPLDNAIAVQAQTSGMLHAKASELETLQREATARLAELRVAFAEGVKASKKVVRDLEWSQRHVRRLTKAAKEECPIEYVEAEDAVKRHTRAL